MPDRVQLKIQRLQDLTGKHEIPDLSTPHQHINPTIAKSTLPFGEAGMIPLRRLFGFILKKKGAGLYFLFNKINR